MHPAFEKIDYRRLNGRQQEAYNFQKISGILADYGYLTIRLSDDWGGADFIAQHIGGSFLKVQLKGRMTFNKKYLHRELYICFREGKDWFLYPHDTVLTQILSVGKLKDTKAWEVNGGYHFPRMSKSHKTMLEPYRLVEVTSSAAYKTA